MNRHSFTRRLLRNGTNSEVLAKRWRPRIEPLEERFLPASFYWPAGNGAPPSDPDSLFVANLYNIALNRPVKVDELAKWKGELQAGSTPAQVAEQVLASEDYRAYAVHAIFSQYLKRAPTAAQEARYVAFLGRGGSSKRIAVNIAGSPAYFRMHGRSNVGFIQAFYEDSLERPATFAEIVHWGQFLARGASRASVASHILARREYNENLVATFFQMVQSYFVPAQGPGPIFDADDLARYVRELRRGATPDAVFANILGTPEFYFVTQGYVGGPDTDTSLGEQTPPSYPQVFYPQSLIGVGAWTEVTAGFDGIQAAVGYDYSANNSENCDNKPIHCNTNDPIVVNAVRVDLTNPRIQFFVSPGLAGQEGKFQTTLVSDFFATYRQLFNLQVAINGNPWSFPGFASTSTSAVVEPLGLVMSGGHVYSPPFEGVAPTDGILHRTSLVITADNRADIVQTDDPGFDTSRYQYAITNSGLVLNVRLGKVYNASDDFVGADQFMRAARTSVGLSQDGRFLYLVTIDGHEHYKYQSPVPGQSGQSLNGTGATIFEVGEWLRAFGAARALNMDGGGSTTMVLKGTVVTHADDCSYSPNLQRYVPVQFGVGFRP